ncbi:MULTISPECIES: hypothetical protein [unclassified Nodularia (in: cyanobacteria)]|uniref:hypothetical protein n=1 Tax=unclassified Nodularia (in: cyanobacteria) TaxID=2656917 RepID=UPI00187ED949|nr:MULTISPECIES: hypothetical protein [unclassified Nodularia (in: cyanobacteria)]MBE9202137.1 hypothetical protein [Nodularia sp. LEGE 06071]MCC2696076.1 hypothetical protein [Nodularia sp. LEGE 04288]
MPRILELQDADNFSLQYSNFIPATVIEMVDGKNLYAKLTEVIVPTIFDRPIILALVTTTVPVGKIWRYAGQCSQIASTGLGDSFVGNKKPLFLSKGNLLIFDEVSTDYTVTFLPPPWFINFGINLYQYDGADTSNLEIDLARIEDKIDALT